MIRNTGKQARAADAGRARYGAALRTLVKLLWQVDKGYFALLFLLSLAGALSTLINLALPKLLIDGFSAGWPWSRFLQGIALFVAVKYLVLQLDSWLTRRNKLHQEDLSNRLPMVFAHKAMKLPYPMLEDPQVLDLKERALFPLTNYGALYGLLDHALAFLTGLFTLGGLAALLFQFSPLFLLALVALCLAATLLSARFVKYMRVQQQQLIPVNRKYGYWSNATTQPQYQKEYRVYGLHAVMTSKTTGYTDELMRWMQEMYSRRGNNESLQTLMTALMRTLAYGYAALRVLGPGWGAQISLGDYSVIVMAAENFFSTFNRAFTGLFQVIANLHHLLPFAQFMALKEAEEAGGGLKPAPLCTLAFEGVFFRYPAGDRVILDDISFEVSAGEKISIVGLNNAGKSTMVKLICRLFEPTAGRILWNGVDIREYDYAAYLKQLSCVFQDFFLFPFSIRDNLDPEGTGSDEDVRAVLKEADMLLTVAARPGGINTYLNKAVWDEATEFSGGERQKLAIARSLFRASQLVILDEPTAALDPLAESEVYEHFHQLVRGRTAIFISHRMSSSTFCDRILLLQDGRVAAFDSHQNLMRGHNLYRELFEAQAQHFREGALVDEGILA